MKTLLAITALVSFQFAVGQKTIELKDFKGLSVGADTKVTLVKSSQNKLVVSGKEEDNLEVQNDGGSLALNNGEDLEITLYYKGVLTSISAASDAQVYGKDEMKTSTFSLAAASDAKVELKLNVEKLNTDAASDARVTLTGKATDHNATMASDADLDGQNLLTENTNIVLSSDAKATITAKGTVNATVSSDGSLTIYGKPKKVNEVKSGDGKIAVMD